jgi:hypothetical protein
MDISILFFGALALSYVGILIYLANQNDLELSANPSNPSFAVQQRSTVLRWMLYGVAAMNFVYGLLIVQMAWLGSVASELPELEIESRFRMRLASVFAA